MSNSTEGKHLIIEFTNCDKNIINDIEIVDNFLFPLMKKFNLNVIAKTKHKFEPSGFTLLYLLSESHLSMHTWPEYGYLSFDLYSCGESDTKCLVDILKEFLNATNYKYTFINRGIKKDNIYTQNIEYFI